MNEARKQFYTNFISENSSNQRDLFNATRKLLKQENEVLFPPFKDRLQLANEMGDFFIKKISDHKMTELPSCDPVSLAYDCDSVVTMQTFSQLTESNVRDLVLSSAKKTYMLDPMPTPLVVTCLDVLLPVLKTRLSCLVTLPMNGKCALVNPLLKKPGLDGCSENEDPRKRRPKTYDP